MRKLEQAVSLEYLADGEQNFSLQAWKLDPYAHDFGEEVSELIIAERDVPVSVSMDRSLRAKVIDSCGMTCVFCHNEGTPVAADVRRERQLGSAAVMSGRSSVFSATNGVNFVPGAMQPDESFRESLVSLKEGLGLNELHLTGGEPSLHRSLAKIIGMGIDAGYKVKMTSNGENGARHIPSYAAAGLEKVNFSIFGTTPEELASVQNEKYADPRLAEIKINALHRPIATAIEHDVEVAANVVVPSIDSFDRLNRILNEFEPRLSLRLLNDLDEGANSYYAIYKFLSDLQAQPIGAKVEAGSSNARVLYRLPDGRQVYFKHFRTARLPDTCNDCEFNSDEMCKEGFYGVRLYADEEGKYKVGVCIQRMDLTQDLCEFTQGDMMPEIKALKSSEYDALQKVYGNK